MGRQMPAEIEICANCDRAIGRLETPMVWQESIVCAECFNRLGQSPAQAVAAHEIVASLPLTEADLRSEMLESTRTQLRRPGVINTSCPHCGGANTALCSVMYDKGTSVGGAIFGGNGGSGFGLGVSQSGIASRCSPPAKSFFWGISSAETQDYDRKMADWRRTWFCSQCGHTFLPS